MANMDETEFAMRTGEVLKRIESAIDACGADFDCSFVGDGVLEIDFDDDSKIIVNRHTAAQEIWVAARSGGFHYRHVDGRWIDTRSGEELFAALTRLISDQTGQPVVLD